MSSQNLGSTLENLVPLTLAGLQKSWRNPCSVVLEVSAFSSNDWTHGDTCDRNLLCFSVCVWVEGVSNGLPVGSLIRELNGRWLMGAGLQQCTYLRVLHKGTGDASVPGDI